jgi:hypothetical protein
MDIPDVELVIVYEILDTISQLYQVIIFTLILIIMLFDSCVVGLAEIDNSPELTCS